MLQEKRPKVSVCVVTYNQARYIRQCLQSIVDQQANFDFEVIVGDDCSSDGTREIVQEFTARYPEILKPILQEKNIGGTGTGNYLIVNKAASGDYVSHVDGDDILLPGKLQIMVDCLQKNPGAAAAVHQLEVINKDGSPAGWIWPEKAPAFIDMEYMLKNHPVFGHSSLVYRRDLMDWAAIATTDFIDFYVYLLLAAKGKIVFVNKILGCYRGNVGISSNFYKFLPYIEFVFCEAEKLGVPKQIVKHARAYHLYKISLSKLFLELSHEEFFKYIEQSFHQAVIGLPQCILFFFKGYPRLLYGLHRYYKHMKNKGLVGFWGRRKY